MTAETLAPPSTEQMYFRDAAQEVTQLDPQREYEIPLNNPIAPGNEYNVTAIINTYHNQSKGAKRDYERFGYDDDNGAGEQLAIIDLRHAPRNPDGSIPFRHTNFDPSIRFLLIDQNFTPDNPDRGFKGIRENETYMFGRYDSAQRFTTRKSTSRSHFTLHYDSENDRLLINDEDSTYGTSVSAQEPLKPVESDAAYQQRQQQAHEERRRQQEQAWGPNPNNEAPNAEQAAQPAPEPETPETKANAAWDGQREGVYESLPHPGKLIFERVEREYKSHLDINIAKGLIEQIVKGRNAGYSDVQIKKELFKQWHPNLNPQNYTAAQLRERENAAKLIDRIIGK